MTLDWVFADEKRVAFGYIITGLLDIPKEVNLRGNISVKDQQCKLVGGAGGGSSSVQWVKGNPVTVTGSWGTVMREILNQSEASLSIGVTLDKRNEQATTRRMVRRLEHLGYKVKPGAPYPDRCMNDFLNRDSEYSG